MLHFTCDLCGCQLSDQRFVAKLDVYPAFDPEEVTEEDLEEDHLQAIANAIEETPGDGPFPLDDCGSKSFRFDLCPHCHKRFLNDPLGRDAFRRLNFSEN